ncbi:hypothetical protein CY35_10G051000 [Sphagnum magellanicum]|nr:hypothetical protein CY35_10G051000 [Sphagnum magellanicum]
MSAMTLAQRIEHDLKSNGGEYVIRNNGPSKKSGVWEAFGSVYNCNNIKLDYVACNRNIDSRVRNDYEKLTLVLKKHFDSGLNVACTLNLWMDAVKKNSYMSITIHYIDEMFNLYARTHHVKPVEEANHMAEMVLEEFSKGLAVFKVMANMYQQIIVVSDSGSNCCGTNGIPSAFYWLACLDHKLATNATRWNSLLRCLLSIEEMYDELVPLLQMKDKLSKFSDISQALLKELITFLAPFQQATLAFEKFKHPTLHKVVWWRHVILGHLKLVLNDVVDEDGNMTTTKDSDKFVLDDIHVMASLLDPIMKSRLVRLGVERNQIEQAKDKLKKKAHSSISMYD